MWPIKQSYGSSGSDGFHIKAFALAVVATYSLSEVNLVDQEVEVLG